MTKRPLLIAHISDLHISTEHSRHIIRNVRQLLEHIIRLGVDHIVITGDITADAKPKEFEAARQLFKRYGLLDARKLSLVIGNHDIFGGVHIAEELFVFPERCKMTGYEVKLKLFRESFHEVFEKTILAGNDRLFPSLKFIDDIALVGINSVAPYSRLGNPIGSNGEVRDDQFSKLKAMLTADLFKKKRKLVLIHHHFNKLDSETNGAIHGLWTTIEKRTMKLHGKKRLLQLFRETNVELVLHGHVHMNMEYEREGIRFANTGASVFGRGSSLLHFRLIRVLDATVETSLHALHPERRASRLVQVDDASLSLIGHAAA